MSIFDVRLFDSAQAKGERILKLEGDSFEQGRQHGRAVPDLFAKNLEAVKKELANRNEDDVAALYKQAARFVEETQPDIWQEYKGMAEGSGFAFDDILTLNLKLALVLGFLDVECSQYSKIITQPDGSKRTLIAKTRDLKGGATEHVVLLRHYPDGYQALEVHTAGMIGYPGSIMTNRGFALGTSGVWSKRTPFDRTQLGTADIGTNGHITARQIFSLDDLDGAMARHKRLTGINNLVAMPGELAAFEVTGKTAKLCDRGAQMIVRTNHYMNPDFAELSATPQENTSTFHRYKRIEQMLSTAQSAEDFWRIAQDHDGWPQDSVCRHKTEHKRSSFTSYASVFVLEERKAYIGFGHPCEIAFVP